MATYNIHAGHNYNVSGANGVFSETVEDRKVKDLVISKLRALGHTVYDCTDEDGKTQSQNLANIVSKCNAHQVDLDVSIHFNSFNGEAHGTEVCLFGNGAHKKAGERICSEIAKLGFTNRGIKERPDLYVLRNTNALALLIECCFCDSAVDAKLYDPETMAEAIVKGITGQTAPSVKPVNNNPIKNVSYIVRCNVDGLRRRQSPSLSAKVVGSQNTGYRNKINAEVVADGYTWARDIAGYWIAISSGYCTKEEFSYITKTVVNGHRRRVNPSLSAQIIGTNPINYRNKIINTVTADGYTWGQDIAGYWIALDHGLTVRD